jgi:ribosomal protein S18 acetylase RimI-like enzyme
MNVEVRPARAEEAEATAALVVACYVDGGYVAADSPYVADLLSGAARFREADLLVAVRAGRVVGTATYCVPGSRWAEIAGPDEGEFRMLAVATHERGMGIGTALVQECMTRARAAGAHRLVMSTTQQMAAAHRLYERLGFHRLPDRDWSPRPGLLLWVYGLDLLS